MIERLLKCKLCGGNVSSAASKCPHCGTPNFKADSFLRAEASAREEELLRIRIKAHKEYLAKEGYFPVGMFTDAQLRSYFPDTAKVSLTKRCLTPKLELTRGDVFEICLDGRPINWDQWIPTEYNDYRENVVNVIRTGIHKITFKTRKETKTVEFCVRNSSACIEIAYGLSREFWSGQLRIRDASVCVD